MFDHLKNNDSTEIKMPDHPFFSICIPVYKNVEFLKRLLDSIFRQTFSDYEVVITDDSPDDSVGNWIAENFPLEKIKYHKNLLPLGTPENWNEGIRKATGEWIKLMHDDDWFCTDRALELLYNTIQKHGDRFYFSAFNNVFLDEDERMEQVDCPKQRWKRVLNFPPNLYARNIIGPPSVTLVKNGNSITYDNRLKWLVDIDYYVQLMQKVRAVYIPTPLINIGISRKQVTVYTHNNPEVEIYEGLLLQGKLGDNSFNHILYYDAWWRLLRNLKITDLGSFEKYAGGQIIPKPIKTMIAFHKVLPQVLLQIGFFSKGIMSLAWCYNRVSAA